MPVPAAAPFWYLSVELMSTMPGSTLAATACSLTFAVLAPPELPLGDGICCEDTLLPDVESLWVSATTVPAPAAAASAATTT